MKKLLSKTPFTVIKATSKRVYLHRDTLLRPGEVIEQYRNDNGDVMLLRSGTKAPRGKVWERITEKTYKVSPSGGGTITLAEMAPLEHGDKVFEFRDENGRVFLQKKE